MVIWTRNYLRHPLEVGAIFPSGASLSSLMTKHLQISPDGYIIELGPGIGSFTDALIDHGVPEHKLVLIERSKEFVSYLKKSYPSSLVVHGDAIDIRDHLRTAGIQNVEYVISGIPLVSCGLETRKSICNEALGALNPGGSFVQVTYFGVCPIPLDIIKNYNAKKIFCGVAKLNLPPGFVWRIEKPRISSSQNGT